MSDPERSASRCLVMGIVNVTPDSFSDGGLWLGTDDAIQHGLSMLSQGADLIDIGGESTRPGAERVPVEEELRRVIPVVTELAAAGVRVSIDTTRATVAQAAVAAGAVIVNDVSGGLADPEMAAVIADTGVDYVVMHWRGDSTVMDSLDRYEDVVADVRAELDQRVNLLIAAGVRSEQIILDPGLGFAKAGASNWPLVAHTNDLVASGFRVLIGASRKRFLGSVLSDVEAATDSAVDRDAATAAITTWAAAAGAWAVRVHDVAPSVAAVRTVARIQEAL